MGIRVRTLDAEGLRRWHQGSDKLTELGIAMPRPAFAKRKVEEIGETILCWEEDPPGHFSWICPGCGGLNLGQLGDEPMGGWDEPRWVNSGTRDKPTLTPSLGCFGWRNGFCDDGHYRLRDGELIPA